jgi:hypothetical protein
VNSNLADFDRQENNLLVKLLHLHYYDRSSSFQKLLQQQLLTATITYLEKATTPTTQNRALLLDKIAKKLPLHLDRTSTALYNSNNNGYFYRSAVCLSLASYVQMSPLTIAQQLEKTILDQSDDRADSGELETLTFIIDTNEAGWINFFPEDRALAIWLSYLCNINFTPFKPTTAITENIFPLQYSHARCLSLLRLAARQEIINLSDNDLLDLSKTILFFNQNIYLNRDNRLIFEEEVELKLIEVLLKTTDLLTVKYSTQQLLRMAFILSKSFLNFYDCSPIFHPRERNSLSTAFSDRGQLIQARLGLIATVEFLFKQILIHLYIEPLVEL